MTLAADLAAALDDERMARDLQRQEVAARMGVHPSQVSRPLNGALTLPTAERIAQAIGVEIVFTLRPASGGS